MEAGADKSPELDPNFGKSKGDIKKEAISKGANSAPSPADKIGQTYKDTKPVKEEKKELPFCGPKLGAGVPCKKLPICSGNGGNADPHVAGENCRPAGPRGLPPHQHLPPELESHQN